MYSVSKGIFTCSSSCNVKKNLPITVGAFYFDSHALDIVVWSIKTTKKQPSVLQDFIVFHKKDVDLKT